MKFKISKNVKFLFIFFIFIIITSPIILSFLSNTIENFSNLTPGKYPESETNYLLYDFYPEKKNGNLGVTDSQSMYTDYYNPNVGNSKYLANPNNGSCSPPEFCGPFYNNKKVIIPPQPPIIPFSSPQVRVNFYGSHPLICPENYYPHQD